MTENDGQWERELVTRLASAALKEQRRARLWGIFFKLLTFAYITFVLLLAVDWKGRAELERTAAGRGAFFGRIWGTVGKLAVGAVMLAIVAWDACW